MPPGRNVKQQLAVKKTVNKWKRNTGVSQGQDQGQGQGPGAGAGNGSRGPAAVTSAQHYNGGVAEKKDSIVMAKTSAGMRSSNIRHEVEKSTKCRENFHNTCKCLLSNLRKVITFQTSIQILGEGISRQAPSLKIVNFSRNFVDTSNTREAEVGTILSGTLCERSCGSAVVRTLVKWNE